MHDLTNAFSCNQHIICAIYYKSEVGVLNSAIRPIRLMKIPLFRLSNFLLNQIFVISIILTPSSMVVCRRKSYHIDLSMFQLFLCFIRILKKDHFMVAFSNTKCTDNRIEVINISIVDENTMSESLSISSHQSHVHSGSKKKENDQWFIS